MLSVGPGATASSYVVLLKKVCVVGLVMGPVPGYVAAACLRHVRPSPQAVWKCCHYKVN